MQEETVKTGWFQESARCEKIKLFLLWFDVFCVILGVFTWKYNYKATQLRLLQLDESCSGQELTTITVSVIKRTIKSLRLSWDY